jgi:Ca2+-binding EF-hand superfamily protein
VPPPKKKRMSQSIDSRTA